MRSTISHGQRSLRITMIILKGELNVEKIKRHGNCNIPL